VPIAEWDKLTNDLGKTGTIKQRLQLIRYWQVLKKALNK